MPHAASRRVRLPAGDPCRSLHLPHAAWGTLGLSSVFGAGVHRGLSQGKAGRERRLQVGPAHARQGPKIN